MRGEALIHLLDTRRGHFRFESGHHGDLWLDLDGLFLRPAALRPFAGELARGLSTYRIDAVCGPLTGGSFLAQMIAADLDIEAAYSEWVAEPQAGVPFATRYRIPVAVRAKLRGKRVAIVDDAINAGSAVRATLTELKSCGATPLAIGALLVLGPSASELAARHNIPLHSVAGVPSGLWLPSECPLCASGVPLENDAGSLPATAPAQPGPVWTLRHDLKPGDLGSLIGLHGTVYAEEYRFDVTFEAYVAGPLAEFVRTCTDRDRLWIAERGGRIVGCIAIVGASRSAAQLRWFLVDPAARGVGLGKALLREAVEFCKTQGYESVFLWTVSALTTAARLYRRFGFERVEERPGRPWGVDVVEARYVLPLSGARVA